MIKLITIIIAFAFICKVEGQTKNYISHYATQGEIKFSSFQITDSPHTVCMEISNCDTTVYDSACTIKMFINDMDRTGNAI